MLPSISVLITYWNEGTLLTECLDSLFAGESEPNEVIVYDDASSIPAAHFVPPHLPVRLIRGHVNVGPSCGRNYLLAKARSEYVHFHDADDLFAPTWCSRVRGALVEDMADAVFTEIASYRDGSLEQERVLGLNRLLKEGSLVRFCIAGSVLPPAGTYRKARVEAIGGYRPHLWQAEDFDFHVRLAASGITFRTLCEPLINLRLRKESRSQRQLEVWADQLKSIRLLSQEIPSAYLVDLAEAAARCGTKLFALGAYPDAREAFKLAVSFGAERYAGRPGIYGRLARKVGPYRAEQVGHLYRTLLPARVRRAIRVLD